MTTADIAKAANDHHARAYAENAKRKEQEGCERVWYGQDVIAAFKAGAEFADVVADQLRARASVLEDAVDDLLANTAFWPGGAIVVDASTFDALRKLRGSY